MQGRFKDALTNLEAAVKLRPGDPALRDDLARVQKFLASRPPA
jgi:Flp pilus assembly protein TadD